MIDQAAVSSTAGAESRRLAAGGLRREEIALALTLLAGVGLSLSTGTGFEAGKVFGGYLAYFGRYGLFLFAIARLAHLIRVSWRPSGRLGRRMLGWLGGPSRVEDFFAIDFEFLRGFLLLLVTITVYTNLKVRIPLIHSVVGDDLFQALDNLLLGERLVPWIERFAELNPYWAHRFDRIYNHGFIWMIVLVLWLWMRNDAPRMRWLFSSFCLLYMVCIFITLAYPSYGPFFLDWPRFRWAGGTASAFVQIRLVDVYLATMAAAEQGRPIPDGAFHGIAAFPSLHVAFMIMLSVVGWKTARPFAIFMIGVAIATTIATLVFGWHYLVDALAGGALAVLVPLLIRPWIFGKRPTDARQPAQP